MGRKRVILKPGTPNEKIDRILFSSAGNLIIRSDYGNTDYACGLCGEIGGMFAVRARPVDAE